MRFRSIAFFIVVSFAQAKAQNILWVTTKNNTTQSFGLSSIKAITFPQASLQIQPTKATASSFPLSTIRNLRFSFPAGIEIERVPSNTSVRLFPNPLNGESLYLQFSENGDIPQELEILSLQGGLLYRQRLENQNNPYRLDLSSLPLSNGLYLCRLLIQDRWETKTFIVNR